MLAGNFDRTDKKMPKVKNGFTLIEVMVVLIIIGIVTTFAVLAIGDAGQGRRIQAFASKLTHTIQLAQEQAILQHTVIGLQFSSNGYQFYRYDKSQQKNQWQPLTTSSLFAFQKTPDYIELNIKIDEKTILPTDVLGKLSSPTIVLSSNGNITPFILKLGKRDELPLYQISGKFSGQVNFSQVQTAGNGQ